MENVNNNLSLIHISIAMYEGEINMVIHANGGEITVDITPECIIMQLQDIGPGIADIDKAMQARCV